MKKLLFIIFPVLFAVSHLKAQYFVEDFENGGAFPSGWTLTNAPDDWLIGDGTNDGPGTVQSGSYCAYFDDYNYLAGTTADMITPRIDLTLGANTELRFWYHDGDGTDNVEVLVSTDSVSWSSVLITAGTVDPWTEQVVDISSLDGEDSVWIAFRGVSVYGFSNPHVDNITVLDGPTCPDVTSLSSFLNGTDSANLTWLAGGADTAWIVEYDTAGFAPGTGITLQVSDDTTTLYGLIQNTNYDFYVRGICGLGDTSIWSGPLTFSTQATCPVLTIPYVYNVGSDSTDLTWTAGSNDTAWIVEYGLSGFALGTGTSMQIGNDTTTLLGLTQATGYDIYVRGICGAGDTSVWVGPVPFTSRCAFEVAPWTETFAIEAATCFTETGSEPFDYGSNVSTPAGFADYGADFAPDYTTGGGGTFIGIDGSGNNDGDSSVLTTPFVDISALTVPAFSFAYFSNNVDDAALNKTYVEFYDGTSWIPLDTIQANLGSSWVVQEYDLSAYTITGNVQARVAVVSVSNGGNIFNHDILFDDISFNELRSCVGPIASTSNGVTEDSVYFAWTGDATDSAWVVQYGQSGFAIGTGTTVSVGVDSLNIGGLAPATSYDIYVRGVCSAGDSSAWFGPLTVMTNCPTAFTPSYLQDFAVYDPLCWYEADAPIAASNTLTPGTNGWDGVNFGNAGTNQSAYINLYDIVTDWLVSPVIDLGSGTTNYQLSFDVAATAWNSTVSATFDADDSVSLIISLDSGATFVDTNIIHTWKAGNEPSNTGDAELFNLAGYTGKVAFAFYAASSTFTTDSDFFIDNFLVDTAPACPDPSSISLISTTQDSAILTWVQGWSDSAWILEYDTTGFTPGTGTVVNAANDTASINGLIFSTTYDVYLRSICSSTDTSNMIGPLTFTTKDKCPDPSAITDLLIDRDSAIITWTPGISDSIWFVEYDTTGFTPGTGNDSTLVNDTITLLNLSFNTTYDFYLRSLCKSQDSSTLIGPFTFTTLPSCPGVDSISAFGTLDDTTSIAIVAGTYDSVWQIQYGSVGFPIGTGTIVNTNTDTVGIGGLSANSSYHVYVRSICTVGDTSAWYGPITVNTLCIIHTAPHLEMFNVNTLPFCWAENGDNSWEYGSSATTPTGFAAYGAANVPDYSSPATGTFIGMDGSDNSNGDISNLITPFIDISSLTNPGLMFSVFSNNIDDAAQNKLLVEVYDGTSWVQVDSIQANLGVNWERRYIDLSAFGSLVQARFSVEGVSNGGSTFYNDILLDDIEFDNIPSCLPLSGVSVYSIGIDSANITWTPGPNDSAWIIEYGPAGFTPGTGTILGSSNDSATVSGLLSDTPYDFYVRGVCTGNDTSTILVGPATDTTLPKCLRAQSVTILNSDSVSINIGWNTDPTQASYIVEYGPAGFTPGTGTTATVIYPNNFYQATGLNPSSSYDFYIQTVCNSGDSSVLDGPYTGYTECSVLSFNLSEGFESIPAIGANLMPQCWLSDGDWESAIGVASNNRGPRTDSTYIFVEWSADDWVFAPFYNLTAGSVYEFSFWYNTDGNSGWDSVRVGVGNDQSSAAMTEILYVENDPLHTTYKEVKTYYTPTVSGVYTFGVHVSANFSPWYLSFDDFGLRDTTNPIGIDELTLTNKFIVYPNPNEGEFTLLNQGENYNAQMTLHDLQGRVVYQSTNNFSKGERKQISIRNANAGVYILSISDGVKTEQHRIVIE